MFIDVSTPASRRDRGEPEAACGCRAALADLRASVEDLALEIRRLGAQQARRRAPRSSDGRDELLLLLLTSVFGDDAVQVVDIMRRAAQSAEIQQALEHAGIRGGRQLGRWLERLASGCDIDGVHIMKIGSNNCGCVWRFVRA